METGLSLFAQSHLPKTFWVEYIYVINGLPTTVLDNRSPFQVLLNQTPDYSILRTFGCACYPLPRPYDNPQSAFSFQEVHILVE